MTDPSRTAASSTVKRAGKSSNKPFRVRFSLDREDAEDQRLYDLREAEEKRKNQVIEPPPEDVQYIPESDFFKGLEEQLKINKLW